MQIYTAELSKYLRLSIAFDVEPLPEKISQIHPIEKFTRTSPETHPRDIHLKHPDPRKMSCPTVF